MEGGFKIKEKGRWEIRRSYSNPKSEGDLRKGEGVSEDEEKDSRGSKPAVGGGVREISSGSYRSGRGREARITSFGREKSRRDPGDSSNGS